VTVRDAPGDTVTVELANEPGIILTEIRGDGGNLPKELDHNTATVLTS